ncbi:MULTISPECIES: CaiB/BaiF CoA transferase family protein [Cupriavidus]|uniref:L-carnitine dehydratase/bile acid-inducible protein F n=1 Tax=Cupriavidus pinatubonensis (strain JMP 134 / LMG 1197) TaxID=264198 RepID=Q46NH3_CUPPJ|nr:MULTISPECIES: CaiB/BaiF CoA-transferase family protein [Cupriavidus]TPQ38343.1 CoA transferase [Cupriavidus pinatubonensis]
MTKECGQLPLAGITVVDLTRVLAGPYCTMMLADLGARVIKIENPDGGDDSRQVGPFVDGESAYFASINRNKESIALDLKNPADRKVLDRMLATADVLVENFRAGVMEKLGFTWEDLHARYPRLVYASISGFGQTGPYRNRPAYDMVVQAMGGLMSVTGEVGGNPARVGVSIGDIGAGLYATIGIQSALLKRLHTGLGERVDISMLDCQVALLENPIARYSATGSVPKPLGTRHPSITPFDMFATKDGFIVIAVGNDALFTKLCNALGRSEWAQETRFATVPSRNEHHVALKACLESRLADATTSEWETVLEAAGVPHGPMNSVPQLVSNPHVQARGMILDIGIGDGKALQIAGNPVKIGAASVLSGVRNPPALDQDRERLLAEFAG